MAKAYAHQRDRSMSPSSEECVAAGMLHKRAANGAHANGTGALRAATQPEENGCGSSKGNGKDTGHAAVGGARPRPLDVPALSLWEHYVRANRTHPLQTKCITTGFPSCRLYRAPCVVRDSCLGAAPTTDAGVSMRAETPWLQPGVLMATGNFGAQLIMNFKGKQKGIIYKKVGAGTLYAMQ